MKLTSKYKYRSKHLYRWVPVTIEAFNKAKRNGYRMLVCCRKTKRVKKYTKKIPLGIELKKLIKSLKEC